MLIPGIGGKFRILVRNIFIHTHCLYAKNYSTPRYMSDFHIFLDVITEQDIPVRKEESEVIHAEHLLHRAVHVLLVNRLGEIFVRQRSLQKELYPGIWSTSVGEHVSAGESYDFTAHQALKEFLSLELQLSTIGKVRVEDTIENELVTVYLGTTEKIESMNSAHMEGGEFLARESIQKLIDGKKTTPHLAASMQLYDRYMNSKNTNVVLLHGRFSEKINGELVADIPLCNPNNEGNWMGWIKKSLELQDYTVMCPLINDVWKAPYAQWQAELDKLTINEQTVLVGLSAGGYALLRYLGETGRHVKKVILIAPGSKYVLEDPSHERLPFEEEFYSYEVTASIQGQIEKPVVIFVSNDWDAILKSVEMYKDVLNAKVITLQNLGHFSFLITELPELLSEIVS